MRYKPTEADKIWTQRHLALLSNGAVWGVPASATFYRVNKEDKTLMILRGMTHPINERIEAVLEEIGWKLVTPIDKFILDALPGIVWIPSSEIILEKIRGWESTNLGGNWKLCVLRVIGKTPGDPEDDVYGMASRSQEEFFFLPKRLGLRCYMDIVEKTNGEGEGEHEP